MLQVAYNALTSGCSGKLGNIVYRRRGNKVIVAKLSGKKHAKGTKGQRQNRDQFAAANHYATAVMANEAQAALYKRHTNANVNVRNLAVRDFRISPTIHNIDVTAYDGSAGRRLLIDATDDFMVSKVSVAIFNNRNELIETGQAAAENDGWAYLATQQLRDAGNCRIVVTVLDMPGNAVTEEVYVHATVLRTLENKPEEAGVEMEGKAVTEDVHIHKIALRAVDGKQVRVEMPSVTMRSETGSLRNNSFRADGMRHKLGLLREAVASANILFASPREEIQIYGCNRSIYDIVIASVSRSNPRAQSPR